MNNLKILGARSVTLSRFIMVALKYYELSYQIRWPVRRKTKDGENTTV